MAVPHFWMVYLPLLRAMLWLCAVRNKLVVQHDVFLRPLPAGRPFDWRLSYWQLWQFFWRRRLAGHVKSMPDSVPSRPPKSILLLVPDEDDGSAHFRW